MKKIRHRMVPAIYVLMKNSEGKILGMLRKNTHYMDGFYTVPGGHVEQFELPIKAAIRETKEEVGVDINPKDLQFVHLLVRPEELNGNGERVDIFFETTKWQGELANSEPEKCEKLQWIDIHDDSVKWIPYEKSVFKLIEQDISYSEWQPKSP